MQVEFLLFLIKKISNPVYIPLFNEIQLVLNAYICGCYTRIRVDKKKYHCRTQPLMCLDCCWTKTFMLYNIGNNITPQGTPTAIVVHCEYITYINIKLKV